MELIKKNDKIFLVGIGGIGMSGIAEILHNLGYKVYGSDLNESSNVRRLRKIGINVYIGHDPSNVKGSSLLVYSSAVSKRNSEIIFANNLAIPVVSRSEMLAELMRMKKTITIAGSHGKTSTTSIISDIFYSSHFDPTVINGGIINSFGSNTKLGSDEWMIVETDESDGSFIDLPSFCGVITSIDNEHLDFYGSMKSLNLAFEKYINNISIFGFVAVCSDDQRAYKLAKKSKVSKVFFYGHDKKANIMAKNIQNTKSGTKFDVQLKYNNAPKREVKNFFVPTHGKHNINNALSAITVTSNLGVDFQNIKIGLKNYKGVKRRLSFINNVNGVSFYDDYAHHPTEIQATLSALKILKKKRIISIVQPHRYSRLKNTFTQFCNSFDKSNITLFLPVYAAGEKTIGRYNSKYLAESIKKNGKKNIYYCQNAEELENFLINNLRKKDLVVFMGAGNISKMAHEFVNKYIRLNK